MVIVKAEQNRLSIRGLRNGRSYQVEREGKGWRVTPARTIRPKADLAEHLQALADAGLSFEPMSHPAVPPCRF